MTEQEAREVCERFALKHKVVFDDAGECGFGRECVGIRHGNNWVDHNPRDMKEYNKIPGFESDAYPPDDVDDAYHKHDCLAVLGRGEGAIVQLATWLNALEKRGRVEIVQYRTGATGVQAMFSQPFGTAVVVRKDEK